MSARRRAALVITLRNVYTGRLWTVCREHAQTDEIGDVQVQHGYHVGRCEMCAAPRTVQS